MASSFSVVQWNVNGLPSHLEDLKLLTHEHTPSLICLQETHLLQRHHFTLKGYTVFRLDNELNERASGGVAILGLATLDVRRLPLFTTLQAIAVQLQYPVQLTLCTVYLPPNLRLSEQDLNDLLQQLPPPVLLVGDFNGHHRTWGSTWNSPRGSIISKLCRDNNLLLLNNNLPTYSCPRNGTQSCIDLAFSSPRLLPRFTWTVLSDNYGSDHFPVELSTHGV